MSLETATENSNQRSFQSIGISTKVSEYLLMISRSRSKGLYAVHGWEENWDILSTYFDYPVEVRKIIYTTNAIEGLNRQFRKVTKTKNVFPNDDSLRKMLYLAIQNLSSRWTQRCRNWDLIINQLRIMDSNEG